MTIDEFDKKYTKYLEPGHYGMAINDVRVIDYLDDEFTKEISKDPLFSFAQIKIKFGYTRCYTSSDKNSVWEKEMDAIMRVKQV